MVGVQVKRAVPLLLGIAPEDNDSWRMQANREDGWFLTKDFLQKGNRICVSKGRKPLIDQLQRLGLIEKKEVYKDGKQLNPEVRGHIALRLRNQPNYKKTITMLVLMGCPPNLLKKYFENKMQLLVCNPSGKACGYCLNFSKKIFEPMSILAKKNEQIMVYVGEKQDHGGWSIEDGIKYRDEQGFSHNEHSLEAYFDKLRLTNPSSLILRLGSSLLLEVDFFSLKTKEIYEKIAKKEIFWSVLPRPEEFYPLKEFLTIDRPHDGINNPLSSFLSVPDMNSIEQKFFCLSSLAPGLTTELSSTFIESTEVADMSPENQRLLIFNLLNSFFSGHIVRLLAKLEKLESAENYKKEIETRLLQEKKMLMNNLWIDKENGGARKKAT